MPPQDRWLGAQNQSRAQPETYHEFEYSNRTDIAPLHSGGSSNSEFLFNGQNRSRRKSETSADPPNWDGTQRFLATDSVIDDGPSFGAEGSHDPRYGSHSPSPSAHQTTFSQGQAHPPHPLNQHYSFGPPSTQGLPAGSSYLTPDMNGGRRAKADPRPSHVRQSRSDDLRPQMFPQDGFMQGQYLSPADPPPGIRHMGMGGLGSSPGHYRRASSGSRSERGVSAGTWSATNSSRGSPYPSPNVSPRGKLEDLPGDQMSHVTMNSIPQNVAKPNVTTGRTANASHKRRKQEATFICPVPGCGSTFTRSFNLKGLYFIIGLSIAGT